MFNTHRKVLGVIGIIFCLFSSVFAYSGGSGEPNDPYQIAIVSDWQQLMNTSADWNQCFLLTADLDLQGILLTPVGGWPTFSGVFDGNGHIIRNANVNGSTFQSGLFGYVNGQLRNIGAKDVNIIGEKYVGGLVGYNQGYISNCFSMGTISGSSTVGGLVGYNDETITACYAKGSVNGNEYVGGLVGSNGRLGPVIIDCYSTATVTGRKYVGGLAGTNLYTITDCYAAGAVVGDSNVGGLTGGNGGSINACFWDVNTSGQTTSAGGEGKTTAEMKTLSTFTSAGWDFDYTDGDPADWFIQIDEYPILTWQISPADIYTDGRNNFRDFAMFAQYWMREDCAIYNSYCDWSDLDFDGDVDIDDLIILMSYWLQSGIYN